MHRILLRTVVIDVPSAAHAAALDFWSAALAAAPRRGTTHPEYHVLKHPAAVGPVLVQDIGLDAPRFHLDVESDDVAAEVDRLVSAGATIQARHGDWVVLRDPAGLAFCVVPAETGDSPAAVEFAARAIEVQ